MVVGRTVIEEGEPEVEDEEEHAVMAATDPMLEEGDDALLWVRVGVAGRVANVPSTSEDSQRWTPSSGTNLLLIGPHLTMAPAGSSPRAG
jgi:hypothetical protein